MGFKDEIAVPLRSQGLEFRMEIHRKTAKDFRD